MTELGNTLYTKASQIFDGLVASDRKLKRIRIKLRDGTSYFDANDFAVRLGELLSQALNQSTDGLAFMSEEVAQELLEPLLTADHDLIATAIEQVQKNMNLANGVGLNPMIPEVNADRIAGFVKKISGAEKLEDVRWMFGEPVINYSMSVVDEGIEANAKATSKIGLKAYIIREAEAHGSRSIKRGNKTYRYQIPCRWCSDLAGRYDYDDVRDTGNDVYRKHEGCRCQITYVNGTKREDTWSHATWTDKDAAKSKQIINEKIEQQKNKQKADEARKQKRRESIAYVASKLGYSERGASIWLNVNKQQIERFGIDYMIDFQRNADALAKRRARG